MIRAGRIAFVETLPRGRWRVGFYTPLGLDTVTVVGLDPNDVLEPLPNETLQIVSTGVWVSGRRFILYRSQEDQYRVPFEEYSRVHVPADPFWKERQR